VPLITGAGGFIGRAILRRLAGKYTLVGPTGLALLILPLPRTLPKNL